MEDIWGFVIGLIILIITGLAQKKKKKQPAVPDVGHDELNFDFGEEKDIDFEIEENKKLDIDFGLDHKTRKTYTPLKRQQPVRKTKKREEKTKERFDEYKIVDTSKGADIDLRQAIIHQVILERKFD